jgi:arylsulfatase A-like enzyme
MTGLSKTGRIALAIGFAALLAGGLELAVRAESGPPNVLFIAVDDLRLELGCAGAGHVLSPNIDGLAAEGVLFRNAICQQAVCSPSRTSLMTGLRPDSTRIYDLTTHFRETLPDVVTLSQHFKNAGYRAEGYGKIYQPGITDDLSWSTPWMPTQRDEYQEPANAELVAERFAAAQAASFEGRALRIASKGPATEAADVGDEEYRDGATCAQAIAALKRLSELEQPFFLAVGFEKPHLPFACPKRYWDLYDPGSITLTEDRVAPEGAPSYATTNWGELRNYSDMPEQGPLGEGEARRLRHGYYACVSYVDALVGRLLTELEHLQLEDRTIVVLWGDHGYKLGEHGGWCKHTNYDLDLRAPLIVRDPRRKARGVDTDALVEFVDVYPTLCELARIRPPDGLEGTSFKPLLDDPDRAWKRAAFSQYPRSHAGRALMGYSMRTARHHLVVWQLQTDPEVVDAIELYELQSDPGETRNVAARPEKRALLEDLMQTYRAGWRGALPPGRP